MVAAPYHDDRWGSHEGPHSKSVEHSAQPRETCVLPSGASGPGAQLATCANVALEQRTMRKSKVETAKTRERIVKAAGAEFAANGISEAALARVMAAAGLTH